MKDLEFYIFDDDLWCMFPDGRNERVNEDSTLVKEILDVIREQYPEAYEALMKCYRKSSMNVPYFQYLVVRRFCKCNFGNLDNSSLDVDSNGLFHFERVPCPLRGECQYEGIICGAKFNSRLSQAEIRVMKLVYDGKSNEEVASCLYLSPNTVKSHIKSVYQKLGIHDRTEFVRYVNSHNLF